MQFITLGAAAAAGVWSFQQMQQRQAREDQLFDGARAETPTQPPPSEADLQAGRATRWLKLQDDKKSAKLGSGAACALSGQLAVITDKISGRLMEVALTEEGWELRRGVKNNSMSFNSAKATSLPMANVFLLRPLERGGVALVSPGADGRCVELQQDKRTGMATVALSRHTKSEAGQAWYVRGDSVVSLGGKCCFQFQPVLALPGSAVAAWETEQMRRFGQVTYKLETTTARLHAAEMRMAELEEQVAGEGAANGTTAATAAAAPALPPPPQQQQAQQRDPSDGQAYVMEQLEVVFAARIWELKQQHNSVLASRNEHIEVLEAEVARLTERLQAAEAEVVLAAQKDAAAASRNAGRMTDDLPPPADQAPSRQHTALTATGHQPSTLLSQREQVDTAEYASCLGSQCPLGGLEASSARHRECEQQHNDGGNDQLWSMLLKPLQQIRSSSSGRLPRHEPGVPAALAPDMLAAGDQDHWTQTEPQLMTPAPQDEGEEEEGDQSQDDDVSSAAASLSSLLGAVSEHVAALTRGVAGGGHVDSSGVWDSESSQAGRSTTSSLRQYSTLLPPPPTFIKADIKLHSDAAIQQQQQTSSQQSGGAVAAARRTSYLC